MYGAFGACSSAARPGMPQARFSDTFFAFKAQLAAFVDYLRTGARPFPFAETVELMKLVIAGIRSRGEGGREADTTRKCAGILIYIHVCGNFESNHGDVGRHRRAQRASTAGTRWAASRS